MRCQASTDSGQQCSREAVFKLDLRPESINSLKRRVLDWTGLSKYKRLSDSEAPGMNCCFYCKQHAKIIGGNVFFMVAQYLADRGYSYLDYTRLHPEYIDSVVKYQEFVLGENKSTETFREFVDKNNLHTALLSDFHNH